MLLVAVGWVVLAVRCAAVGGTAVSADVLMSCSISVLLQLVRLRLCAGTGLGHL
jgi:hypothetical protein